MGPHDFIDDWDEQPGSRHAMGILRTMVVAAFVAPLLALLLWVLVAAVLFVVHGIPPFQL